MHRDGCYPAWYEKDAKDSKVWSYLWKLKQAGIWFCVLKIKQYWMNASSPLCIHFVIQAQLRYPFGCKQNDNWFPDQAVTNTHTPSNTCLKLQYNQASLIQWHVNKRGKDAYLFSAHFPSHPPQACARESLLSFPELTAMLRTVFPLPKQECYSCLNLPAALLLQSRKLWHVLKCTWDLKNDSTVRTNLLRRDLKSEGM